MSDILKEQAKKFNPQLKEDPVRSQTKFKKDNKPGPTSYEVPQALQKSSTMRKQIEVKFSNTKIVDYIGKYLWFIIELKFKFYVMLSVETNIREKKIVPGVGKYKTEDLYKKHAKPITSLRMRRH